jgi:hypothetical protein
MIISQKGGAANIPNSKTEAGAASSARYINFTQQNNLQRGFAQTKRGKYQARVAARGSVRAESGLGFAVCAESAGRRHHCSNLPFLGKRSQAAMEFIMTYGWAILVVLAAIVALAYFGVMSPSRFVPESCTLPPTSGLACVDFNVFPQSAHLFIVNGGGRDLVIGNMSVGSCAAIFGIPLADGQSLLFDITGCDFGASGQKVKLPVLVSYADPVSGFSKSVSGSVIASIG